MKTFEVKVKIRAENLSDLVERMEDIDCPIDEYDGNSIKVLEEY
jgi:hypothetical protein